MNTPLRRSGTAWVLKGSHSFTCTRNEPYLPLPSQPKLVLIYRPRRDGWLSWSWVAGWLHTEINVRHRELNQDTVTHLSTNRARRWLTLLIEANTLTTTPDRQPQCHSATNSGVATSMPSPYTWQYIDGQEYIFPLSNSPNLPNSPVGGHLVYRTLVCFQYSECIGSSNIKFHDHWICIDWLIKA